MVGFGHSELDVSAGRRDSGRPELALVVLSTIVAHQVSLDSTGCTTR